MRKKLVLVGLEFAATNLGCAALAYSFLNILEEVSKEFTCEFDIYVITYKVPNFSITSTPEITMTFVYRDYKKLGFYFKLYELLKSADYYIDFTEGDSFTDLYGIKRFIVTSLIKECAVVSMTKIILGPQTYGPFHNIISKYWAKHILKNTQAIFSRDDLSTEYLKQFYINNVVTVTDIAMMLPYYKKEKDYDKTQFGLNVSGLLWSGGYTNKNQFHLTVDYVEYTHKLIQMLLEKGHAIHLIPHVITNDYGSYEDDYRVCQELHTKYATTILAPKFKNPTEAKSYIANMDWFIGARMHATIASISTGVCTIAFSYSRKFEGLYQNIHYNYVISGLTGSTEEALLQTEHYIDNEDACLKELYSASKFIRNKSDKFKERFRDIIVGQ